MHRTDFIADMWYVSFPWELGPDRQPTVGPFPTAEAARRWLARNHKSDQGYLWRRVHCLDLPESISRYRPIPPDAA